MRVKIITERNPNTLQNQINKFLRNEDLQEIKQIEYRTAQISPEEPEYTALIRYVVI